MMRRRRNRMLKPGSLKARQFDELCERLGLRGAPAPRAKGEGQEPAKRRLFCADCDADVTDVDDERHNCPEQAKANREAAARAKHEATEAPF